MATLNLGVTLRDHLQGLVHASVRDDALAAARHRAFIAPRIIGGLTALALLPLYLGTWGTPGPVELVGLAWLAALVGIAAYLSRTGEYERAYVLSSLALACFVTAAAAVSGGVFSFLAIWLVLIPVEATLSGSRRVVLAATGFAVAALVLLCVTEPEAIFGALSVGQGVSTVAIAATVGAAIVYAALHASGTQAFARASSLMLAREEERYRLIAANMTDVITKHGRNGAVTFASPAVERMLGVPVRDVAGHGLLDRVHVGDRPAYLSALADAAQGYERSVEFRLRPDAASRHSQQFIWVEMRCRAVDETDTPALRDANREIRRVVAVMRDITGRKAQEHALQEARSEAEAANEAKTRFLATMSHELRTPLNAVIGFSEMLMNETAMQLDAGKRAEYAQLIHESGHHLLSVVNLVLDMSKIESGNFVVTPEPFAPGLVIRHCADLLALRAREAGLDLELNLPADLPEITADKRALKQMLLNLLSNAIKFTDRDGRVTISAKSDGPAGDERAISISVQDTGVGIEAKHLPHIGSPFFQAHASYNRPYEGTGLGLSIVKGLVSLHDGRMDIESRLGEGTRVTLWLPIDYEKDRAAGESAVAALVPTNIEVMPVRTEAHHPAQVQVKKSA